MKSFVKDVLTAIAIVLALLVMFGLFALAIVCGESDPALGVNLGQGWYYPLTTKIVEVNKESDVVTCEDFNGHLWEFDNCEDWREGDVCSMIMNSKGTVKITDDVIVTISYNGTFEGWK